MYNWELDREVLAKALANGQKTYVSNNPCKKCGHTLRYTRNKSCVNCLKGNDNVSAKQAVKTIEKHIYAWCATGQNKKVALLMDMMQNIHNM